MSHFLPAAMLACGGLGCARGAVLQPALPAACTDARVAARGVDVADRATS